MWRGEECGGVKCRGVRGGGVRVWRGESVEG